MVCLLEWSVGTFVETSEFVKLFEGSMQVISLVFMPECGLFFEEKEQTE